MKKLFETSALCLIAMCLIFGTVFAVRTSSHSVLTSSAYEETTTSVALVKQGDRGDTVKAIQRKLKNWGYYNGAVDGIFGAGTKKAVVYFQKKNGLTADGVVGSKTLAALGISLTPDKTHGVSKNTDAELLAKLIYAEARGESYVGQVAVGAVVLNRVKNSSFPNSVSGVVYQANAFTCVTDGQINLTPNETARKAARDALNGWDPTGGAIYYYNPAIATSAWIYNRQVVLVIGSHVFAI